MNNKIPEELEDYVYFDDEGYVFGKQKLPSNLEIIYDMFIRKYYFKSSVVENIINKIKLLPFDTEITISELIDYDPKIKFIDPYSQEIIVKAVEQKCKENNILTEPFDMQNYNCKIKKLKNPVCKYCGGSTIFSAIKNTTYGDSYELICSVCGKFQDEVGD